MHLITFKSSGLKRSFRRYSSQGNPRQKVGEDERGCNQGEHAIEEVDFSVPCDEEKGQTKDDQESSLF